MDQVPKAAVRYRPSAVPGIRCGTCVMFHPGSATCDLVAGAIGADDVCDRWEAPAPAGAPEGLPHLYFDVDGVLAFQPEGSILAVNGRFGTSYLLAEATAYPWSATLTAGQRDWLDANQAVIAANLAPDMLAVKALRKAVKAGYRVTVATERDPSLHDLTAAWLAYWGVPYNSLAVLGKGGKPAFLAARESRDAVLIDDAPKFESLAGDGLQVWVPPRPWTPQGDAPEGVWRFGGWRDVKKKLGLLLGAPRQLRRPAGRVRRPLPRIGRLGLPRPRLRRRPGRRRRGGCPQFPEPRVVRGHELRYVPVVALHRPLVRDHPGPGDLEGDHGGGLAPLSRLELGLCALGERVVDAFHGDPCGGPLVGA